MWSKLLNQKISLSFLQVILVLIGIFSAIYIIKQKEKEINKLKVEIITIENTNRTKEINQKDSLLTLEFKKIINKQDSIIKSLDNSVEKLKNKDYELSIKIKNINERVNSTYGTLPVFK